MKIQPYVEKLQSSEEFKSFQTNHPDAFAIAGFFVLDLQGKRSVHQIDYFIPKENKVAAFTLDDQIKLQLMDTLVGDKAKTLQPLDLNTKIDLDELHGILQDEMKNRKMTEDIHKIIAVIQNLDGKKIWNLNCVLSGLEILRSHIEDESKSVLKMEKKSITDFVKTVPNPNSKKLAQQPLPKPQKPVSKEQAKVLLKKELNQLEGLEKEIEKEKEEIKEKLDKN